MRGIVAVVVVLIAVLLLSAGCVGLPPEGRQIIHENAVLQARFVELIDADQVTQEHLEENARVNAENWARLDALVEE